MPDPMRPKPTTPTRSIPIVPPPRRRRVTVTGRTPALPKCCRSVDRPLTFPEASSCPDPDRGVGRNTPVRSKLPMLGALLMTITATLVPSAGYAGTASISIDSVGSHKVKDGQVAAALLGKTLVQGTAIPGGSTAEPPVARPLVAEAGDSGYVASGTASTACT